MHACKKDSYDENNIIQIQTYILGWGVKACQYDVGHSLCIITATINKTKCSRIRSARRWNLQYCMMLYQKKTHHVNFHHVHVHHFHVFNVHVHHGGHALETEEEVVWLMGTEIGCVNFSCG